MGTISILATTLASVVLHAHGAPAPIHETASAAALTTADRPAHFEIRDTEGPVLLLVELRPMLNRERKMHVVVEGRDLVLVKTA